MKNFIKNLEHSKVLPLASELSYLDGQIVSKTLAQNDQHSLTLFAFDQDEEISTHSSDGDALVYALDGEAKIVISGEEFSLKAGEAIVMPANQPHSVYAKEPFKMLLIVLFS
ncbi:MAG: cupin domain-containing protein [Eubacteriales bacterium]|nr:cupin domain-containing protein [Eubacteriales bacterium]